MSLYFITFLVIFICETRYKEVQIVILVIDHGEVHAQLHTTLCYFE